jgi:hypothetical protein
MSIDVTTIDALLGLQQRLFDLQKVTALLAGDRMPTGEAQTKLLEDRSPSRSIDGALEMAKKVAEQLFAVDDIGRSLRSVRRHLLSYEEPCPASNRPLLIDLVQELIDAAQVARTQLHEMERCVLLSEM